MTWLIFVLIGVAGIAVSNILERALLKDGKSDAIAYSFVFQILCGILTGIFAAIHGFVMPPVLALWPNFLLMTLFFAAGTLFLFKGFQSAPAAETTIAFATRSIWTILAALLFLGETFNINKIVGTVLLLLGVVLASFERKTVKFGKGVAWALLAAFFWGLAFANDAYILRFSDSPSYTALAFILPSLPFLIIKPRILFDLKQFFNPRIFWKMLLLGIFYSAAVTADYYAFTIGGNVSQVSPILQSTVVVTVLLAAFFLGERKGLVRKLAAAVIALAGVILLT